jgi:nucleolin
VEFSDSMAASKAQAATNGMTLDGRYMEVDFAGQNKPGATGATSGTPGESDTVFCGNLGFRTTEDNVWAFFGDQVKNVRIATNPDDGRPRGFCHVEFHTP